MAQNNVVGRVDGADALEPIAIIGMACRFPGSVSTPESFWELLNNARKGHGEVPEDRFNAEAWRHPSHERKGAIQPDSGFFLDEDPAVLDAPFFSITAKEAAGMDPMQRKLLEVAYEGFENGMHFSLETIEEKNTVADSRVLAGIPMEKLAGSDTSVYVGVMTNDYEMVSQTDIYNLPHNAASGTSRAMLANRISWFFDLHGASLALDTACSSSLYAFHLACQSLRTGESRQALVGGANMILHPNFISQLSAMHMLSPDGISHSFDARANGYARGEAITTIVVKRLKDALADGDTIRAVVRGTGVNQDGHTPGITMPSSDAQAALIRSTYAAAGLSYDDTGYFEAHGTGTPLGDPLELSAVGAVFGPSRRGTRTPLHVGSVKTNIGHTEGSAGLAGVVKAVLAVEKGYIPANAGFEILNPKLRLDEWGLALPLETMPWPVSGLRRASINSFGFGGANAHVILDDAHHYLESRNLVGNHQTAVSVDGGTSTSSESGDSGISDVRNHRDVGKQLGSVYGRPKVLALSAHDQAGIKRLSSAYAPFAAKSQHRDGSFVHEMAYTLAARRTKHPFRSFAVASTVDDLASGVSAAPATLKRSVKNGTLAFVFTGQGAQWATMGRELLDVLAFKESVLRSQGYLDALGCKWNAIELLCDEDGSRLDIPEFCQPICTVLQVALVDLLGHWGLTAKGTVGHSSGEIAAAYAAGGISHASAIKIAYFRGLYVEEIQRRLGGRRGTMLAAGLTADEAQSVVEEFSSPEQIATVACINSPSSVTISGDEDAIGKLEAVLQQRGKFARKLRVKMAYHSAHMEVIADDFLASMGELELKDRFTAPMFSSVTEEVLASPSQLSAAYWVKNMVSPVLFKGAVEALLTHSTLGEGANAARRQRKVPVRWTGFVEIGPAGTLQGPLDQIMKAVNSKLSSDLTYTSMLKRKKNAMITSLEAAGLLWATGHNVDLLKVNEDPDHRSARSLANLPPYPWQHSKRFWHETPESLAVRKQKRPRRDLLGIGVPTQNPFEPRWRTPLRLEEQPWMGGHVITGTILYPAAGMLIMVLEAALEIAENDSNRTKKITGVELGQVSFERGLVVPNDDAVETHLSMRPDEMFPEKYHWTIFSIPSGGTWQKHSSGTVITIYEDTGSNIEDWQARAESFEDMKKRASRKLDVAAFYDQLKSIGMDYGPLFTNVVDATILPGEQTGLATVSIPDTKSTMPQGVEFPHHIHPATLDAIFHLIFIALFEGYPMDEASIPVTVETIFIATDQPSGAGSKYLGFAKARKTNSREACGDIIISDESWSGPKVVMRNMVVRQVSSTDDKSQSSSSPFSQTPKRVGRLEWKEDVDALAGKVASQVLCAGGCQDRFTGLSNPDLAAYLELLTYKEADLRLLVLHAEENHELQSLATIFAPQEERGLRAADIKFAAPSQELARQLLSQLAARQYPLPNSSDLIYVPSTAALAEDSSDQLAEDLGMFDIVIGDSRQLLDGDGDIGLSHIKSLLHPGGRVALVGDKVSAADYLIGAGFAPVDIDFKNAIVSSSKVQKKLDISEINLIVRLSPSTAALRVQEVLKRKLESSGVAVKSCLLSQAATSGSEIFISLLEFDEPWTINLNAQDLEEFRSLVFGAKYLLWLTNGGIADRSEASLAFSPTTGLLRTIRTEVPQIVLPHLDLSMTSELGPEEQTNLALEVLSLSRKDLYKGKNNEMEFLESGGRLLIPRAVADLPSDHELALRSGQLKSVPGGLWAAGEPGDSTPLKFDVAGSGVWIADTTQSEPLNNEGIEIQTSHICINGSDLTRSSGQFGTTMATEALGRVVRLGSEVPNLKIGDEVVVLVDESAFKTHIRQHFSLVQKIPDDVKSELAVSLPLSFMTAYHAIVEVGRLAAGETVLIHAVHDAVGLAALQIATQLGAAAVFITANNDETASELLTEYNIPQSHIIRAEDGDTVSTTAMKLTSGHGVDIVISAASGTSLYSATKTVASWGRFVRIGTDRARPQDISAAVFERNASISSVDVRQLPRERRARLLAMAFGFLRSGLVKERSLVTTVRAVKDLSDILSSATVEQGNIVIELGEKAVVPVLPRPPAPPQLDADASYLISGGLGALGLTIAKNMALHGARRLVLLSRSGVVNARQEDAIQDIRDLGCEVDTPKCDVTIHSEVEDAIRRCETSGRRLRGVIQCAMVLQDSILQNMTIEKWNTATRPKIVGTWNLHSTVPTDLDFFILLSSMSGIIGNSGQANYCAGNAYEDAIALHRRSLGLAATTLNVGLVTDASHFNATSTADDYLRKYGHWESARVTDDEMQAVIEAVLRQSARDLPEQLLVGITDDVKRDGRAAWPQDRKFEHRIARTGSSAASADPNGANAERLGDELSRAKTLKEAVVVVLSALKANLAAAMTASPDDIDEERPLYSFGVDSLKAVEVRNWIFKELRCDVSVFDILSPSPLAKLGPRIVARSALTPPEIASQALAEA
ncbi:PKSN polyketide synthase for alternapyrone biosynthesis protein [Colletotrichum paranaense]|uniref:PKSN polyketide synthase for alternapyrone biosynthesis protein n=1 Tax=Colletotrichum paranaense TaxID=1914294 RepID=A0ABQ9SNS1_9PEZI|nr:PKSN polyketide synthase for alternapyrone biosynthesis protein [Colletotrichum paranaense]KAK1541152.1 PKSN polyketide synthase for alternapyrone biosynthesis protein [Colletotrichum paranaense]